MYCWIIFQIYGYKFIKLSIIQDIERGKLLEKEFRFVKKIYYVPNSYIGYCDESSQFAYQEFNIPTYKKIIIYSGGVEKGFDLGLFEICGNLDPEYIIFFNSYSRDNYLTELTKTYDRYINAGRLFINSVNLSDEDYDQLIRSSYIGIVWHSKGDFINHDNLYYLGLSSGKLTKYLSCGKPVITTKYPYLYPEFIEGNQLGITCGSTDEIPAKIKDIENNYTTLQQSIKNYYLTKLEYRGSFKMVLDEIKKYV